jgi:pyrroloquinoline quinone (PQQ) biosynthesis protein C
MTANLSPAEQVAALAAEALHHRAVRHPYLRALADGSLPDTHAALADFARHYHGYSAHFPRYLATVVGRLEHPAHRRALLENLTEEAGHYPQEDLDVLEGIGIARAWIEGIPHPELFARFCRAVGVEPGPQQEEALEVACWREMFLAVLQSGSPAEAVGAIGLGTENIVRSIYQPICAAIERVPQLSAEATVFFPLHTAVDDHHQETLQQIAAELAATPQGARDLAKGMRKALALRSSFWDWLEERARSFTRARGGQRRTGSYPLAAAS